jgi:hypothetical protein
MRRSNGLYHYTFAAGDYGVWRFEMDAAVASAGQGTYERCMRWLKITSCKNRMPT